ncbi:hypothetical protein SAMN04488581_2583 [Mycolicibacterium neoaurum]|uniref:hypothetical protein n=1 Tax=Mycolicibacterium neoaurum TaxID=1795 RepID=UPI000889BE59|nr:hypothetical protein [Mycolicibacterium neoaurum]SDD57865.1 hypothetical protein SAMN04488581_2583 [Mycolicibacterium neoaurum]
MVTTVQEIADEHRDRVWKDRHGNFWKWYDDGRSQGWRYESQGERWRFGGMFIPDSGPFTFVTDVVKEPEKPTPGERVRQAFDDALGDCADTVMDYPYYDGDVIDGRLPGELWDHLAERLGIT